MRMAYPRQNPRYRPSGIANCSAQQAALVEGVEVDSDVGLTIWQAELGRAGQDIGLNALEKLGFKILRSIQIDSDTPGEADADIEALPNNVFGWEPGRKLLGEVKCRNTYSYNHVWKPNGDGVFDLLTVEKSTAAQTCIYGTDIERDTALILLLPFDSAGARNDMWDWRTKGPNPRVHQHSPYVRMFLAPIQPTIYDLAMKRKSEMQEYGLKVRREYNPDGMTSANANFPCWWASGSCPVIEWCRERGDSSEFKSVTKIPEYGMPMMELQLA